MRRTTLVALAGAPLVLGVLGVVGAGPSSATTTWTPVASGTTADITAVEYQSASRFWFTTSAGEIFTSVSGSFTRTRNATGLPLTDIEFQPTGLLGFAIGGSGTLLRSTDGGLTWNPVTLPATEDPTTANSCAGPNQPAGDLDSVRFLSDTTIVIAGSGSQVFLSTQGGGATGWWVDANYAGPGVCKFPRDIDDFFGVSGSSAVFAVSRFFGEVFHSTDLQAATVASKRPAEAGNGFTARRRLAGDPANPARQWSVAPGGAGGSFPQRTTDGWTTAVGWGDVGGSVTGTPPLHDVDYNGGTVLAAGDDGSLLLSPDGASFYTARAPGALAVTDWRSVSLASATTGAVGGSGGALVVTSTANTPQPQPPPAPAPPGRVEGLKAQGKATSAARKVTWKAPTTGATPTGYRVVVTKGSKVKLTKTLPAAKRSLKLKRKKLGFGTVSVVVTALGTGVEGPAVSVKVKFKKQAPDPR